MGYDFDTNGNYIGWSPYFNFNSIEALRMSERLPTPNGKLYAYSHAPGAVDITNYVEMLNEENFYNPESLPIIAELLTAIDDTNLVSYTGSDTKNADFILSRINNHYVHD